MRQLGLLLLVGLCGCTYSLPLRVTDSVTGLPIRGVRVGCQESREDRQYRLHQLTWWETADREGQLRFNGLRSSYWPKFYFLHSDYRRGIAEYSAGYSADERYLVLRDAPLTNQVDEVGRIIGHVYLSNGVFNVSLEPSR